MIEVNAVSKVYGKKDKLFIALNDINLKIPDGASVAIVGKSGSGKSTLMHVMSGLDRPDEGQIIIDGNECEYQVESNVYIPGSCGSSAVKVSQTGHLAHF